MSEEVRPEEFAEEARYAISLEGYLEFALSHINFLCRVWSLARGERGPWEVRFRCSCGNEGFIVMARSDTNISWITMEYPTRSARMTLESAQSCRDHDWKVEVTR